MLTLGARHNPALRQMGDETGFLCKKPTQMTMMITMMMLKRHS